MGETKKFRWLSAPGLLLLMVACSVFGDDDDDDEVPPVINSFYVTAEVLNVRENPSVSAAIVAKAKRGTEFVPSFQSGDWFGVPMSDGSTGWIHTNFVAQSPAR